MLENRRGNWKSIGAISDEFNGVILAAFGRAGPFSVDVEALSLLQIPTSEGLD